MKAALYNPYVDTAGGGERYTLAVAQVLDSLGYEVTLWWNNVRHLDIWQKRFGIPLQSLNLDADGFRAIQEKSRWQALTQQRQYDLIFWVSDGSIPLLLGRKNIIHFQVPFLKVKGRSWSNRGKLSQISTIVCNSNYTKQFIDAEYGVKSRVIYPAVTPIRRKQKQKLILSVGRFDTLLHNKRHDVLVDSFNRADLAEWRLVLTGGLLKQTPAFRDWKQQTNSSAVTVVENSEFKQLNTWYGEATIYWHAAGYGQDLASHPERAEHFGITTVEAMSAGAVPLVFAAGGQAEIVTHGVNGFLWHTPEELLQFTRLLIEEGKTLQTMSQAAERRAADFSYKEFSHEFKRIIG